MHGGDVAAGYSPPMQSPHGSKGSMGEVVAIGRIGVVLPPLPIPLLVYIPTM